MEEHAAAIEELRLLAEEYQTDEAQDDLWLLRYILSNGSAAACAPHLKSAVEWRKKNTHIIDMVRNGEEHPQSKEVEKYIATELHKRKIDGGPIFIIRSGISNPQLLMDNIPYETVLEWFMYQRERAHQICDEATRRTGKITKLLSINDFHHIHLMSSRDKRFFNILSETSHLSEDLYPQLVDHNVLTNMPKLMDIIIRVVKKLLPKRTTEKLRYCPGVQSGADISKCPFVSTLIRIEDIPTFLGGTCNCPGGCCGVPNELTERISK